MGDSKVVGIMLCCLDSFVISVLEGRVLGYFVVSFDRTVDDVGGNFVGIGAGGIITDSEIDAMQFNYSSNFPVNQKCSH